MPIETSACIGEFFRGNVEAAMRNQRVSAPPETTAYLAGVLEEFVRPEQSVGLARTLDRSLTLLLDEALTAPTAERFERLRQLGDATLYVSSFFADHLERRGVDDGFVRTIGGIAYGSAGKMVRGDSGAALARIYDELASQFARFVEVLAEVAESTAIAGRNTSKGVLRLYEKWLRTGNERIGRALTAEGLLHVTKPGLA
jgi:hypothetical protein